MKKIIYILLVIILLLSATAVMAEKKDDDKKKGDKKTPEEKCAEGNEKYCEKIDCTDGKVEVCHITEDIEKICVNSDDVESHLAHDHELIECTSKKCSDDKMEICHIPKGNPNNAREICVDQKSIKTHLKEHGDYVGQCVEGFLGCEPIVINAGLVSIKVLEKNAAFQSDVYLDKPDKKLLIEDVKMGKKAIVGYYPDTELRFFIDVKKSWKQYSDTEFCKMTRDGDAYILHFEDMKDGGDWDYNDVVFSVQVEECSKEVCDGIDNDCNGKVDDITRECGESGVGSCSFGTESCNDGKWGKCEDAVYPDLELCDGVDNDCDGSVDESIQRACGSVEGQCSLGTEECVSGEWKE